MSDSEQPKCPVDHSTREAWLKKAQQANKNGNSAVAFQYPGSSITSSSTQQTVQTVSSAETNTNGWGQSIKGLLWASPKSTASTVPSTTTTSKQIAPHPIPEGTPEGATCPVDHEARNTWYSKLAGGSSKPVEKEQKQVTTSAPKSLPAKLKTTTAPEAIEVACSSDNLDKNANATFTSNVDLPEEREISSIPRTGADGNWIYPSQKQFFNAMKRKEWNPEAQDMKTIVPIHNMVNERAWMYIQMWERGQGGEKCGGVKLTSFKGDSKKITPRARIRNLMGYELPFDRHDWTVDRCGTNIDYVIDFYANTPDLDTPEGKNGPTFYLDVRPKLNSWEGVRLRVAKAFGF